MLSFYKETCCKNDNNGKAIKFGDYQLAFSFCPQNPQGLCLPRSCEEVFHLNPNIMLLLAMTTLWRRQF